MNFCQGAVVFEAAFPDTRFGAKGTTRDGVGGNDEEHFVNEGRNRARFALGATGRIDEMAQGIQAAFERKADKGGIVGKCGFLHDAADEVLGD